MKIHFSQQILLVLGIHSPENVGLRKGQFPHPCPFYLSGYSHLAWQQEAKRRWLFRWVQNRDPEHSEPPSWKSGEGIDSAGFAEDSEALGWQNADDAGQSSCQPGPSWPSAVSPLENRLSLPAGTSGNSKGESCAKHYCVKRKKVSLSMWWLKTGEAGVSETAICNG